MPMFKLALFLLSLSLSILVGIPLLALAAFLFWAAWRLMFG